MAHLDLRPNPVGSRSGPGTAPSPSPARKPRFPRLDPETAGHSRRVAWYAAGFAERLGMGEREVELIRLGALMHDIGKAAVPLTLLNKADAPTADEWEHLRAHAAAGERMAAAMGLPKGVQEIIRHHHERWDGAGYPDGLSGEDIPRNARLVCIVDTYDAILTPRSYQAARSTRQALKIMEDQAAGLFDPELLNAFFVLMAPRTLGLGSAAA
jgi:putative nucleotidyltransferase with HDIG domain